MCRGDHWLAVNLPQQRIFWESLLTGQPGTSEQCSPLQEFFDSLTESTHLSILVAVLGCIYLSLIIFVFSLQQKAAACMLQAAAK